MVALQKYMLAFRPPLAAHEIHIAIGCAFGRCIGTPCNIGVAHHWEVNPAVAISCDGFSVWQSKFIGGSPCAPCFVPPLPYCCSQPPPMPPKWRRLPPPRKT